MSSLDSRARTTGAILMASGRVPITVRMRGTGIRFPGRCLGRASVRGGSVPLRELGSEEI